MLPGYARRYVSASGGSVDVHETHGKLELRQNLPVAVFLADRGERVRLLPVSRTENIKNPDAERDDTTWEFKTPISSTANAIDKALHKASRQADRILVVVAADFDRRVLEQAIHDRVRRVVSVVEVAILFPNELHQFTRQQILTNEFRGQMS